MKTRYKIILLLTIIVIVLLVINIIIPAYLYSQSDKLGMILYNCALGIDRTGPLILYSHNNGTHTINENSCTWIKNTIKDSEKLEDSGNYISDEWNPKWGPIPPVSKIEIEEMIVIRGHIDYVSEKMEYLREEYNINTIGTDHENHAVRIGIDFKGLSDSEINDIKKQIRKIVGDKIDITIEHSETIYLR